MTIPTSSNYPNAIDTNENLCQVHDGLRVILAEDYNPGDTIINVLGDATTMKLFDTTGYITLTEQCSEPALRSISFYYGLRTLTTFEQLEILPGFTDVAKPKNITNVTQNVMAEHHNLLINALIAMEKFFGKKGEISPQPLQGINGNIPTMEQRINYLRSIALIPKAWFSADKTVGLAPLTVEFTDQSFRLGDSEDVYTTSHTWDFGDNTGPSIITINESANTEGYAVVPSNISNVQVVDVGGVPIKKTYTRPGVYSPTLTVSNIFGVDTITFPNMITARFTAPDYAVIEFVQYANQLITSGTPIGGPYTTPPTIRVSTNTIIDMQINSGINSNTGETFAGEVVDGNNMPIDPIVSYTWSLSDDLTHNNSPTARAIFSIGGIYNINLRTDTEFGSYRITSYENSIDIVEQLNLWLWTYNDSSLNSVSSSEFGLISETFKTTSSSVLSLNRNDGFLNNAGVPNKAQQLREFYRNNGFAPSSSVTSGAPGGGAGLLYWASGRDAISGPGTETINVSEFNGFLGIYINQSSIARPWNWVDLASTSSIYFFLGGVTSTFAANTSPTNQTLNTLSLSNDIVSSTTFGLGNYINGANELINNEVTYDISGLSQQGNMSVYRSAWHDASNTGFFLRNQGVGDPEDINTTSFFRIKSFYKTSGNLSLPFQNIQKLPDIIGSAKTEGQLVALSDGVYFFNNTGSVSAYSPTSGIWSQGGPGINASAFRSLQDTSVVGFDNVSATLLAASDGQSVAYLSFDYSSNAFIKFNQTDTTFSSVTARPSGLQWQMCIF